MPNRPPNEKNDAAAGKSPDFVSLRQLEACLGVPRVKLRRLAASAGSLYFPFAKKQKLKPFTKTPPKKHRRVDNPDHELKEIQRLIDERLLKPIVLPESILGGVKGKTLRDNIELHAGAPVLVTIDIKSFFPSVTPRQVYNVWCRHGFSPGIAALLTQLTTYSGHLPLGAPTSTSLANLIIAALDPEIRAACSPAGIRYSSWVDDLAFSGKGAQTILPAVIRILRDAGFAVSHRKIRVMGACDRKLLTGIVVSRNGRAKREYIAAVRSGIHHLAAGHIGPRDIDGYRKRLLGCIEYVRRLDQGKGDKLLSKLNGALAVLDGVYGKRANKN